MPTCIVFGCMSGGGKSKIDASGDQDYPTRPLPKSEELRRKWLESINRMELMNSDKARVCFKHFRPDDFVPDSENIDKRGRKLTKKILKPTAIPTLDPIDPLDVSSNSFESTEEDKYKPASNLQVLKTPEKSQPIIFASPGHPLKQVNKRKQTLLVRDFDNPWNVTNASIFLKYCCPECDYVNSNLPAFTVHAMENHILSNVLFNNTQNDDNQLMSDEAQNWMKEEYEPDILIKEEPISIDGKF